MNDGCDRGAGLIGTIAGVLVFLAFLLFAVQLLANLFATSTVTSAAYDGARSVAGADVDHADHTSVAAARARAEDHVRRLLGRMGDRARFDWSGSTSEQVALRVRVEPPRVLPPALDARLGFDEIDRTATARVEQAR